MALTNDCGCGGVAVYVNTHEGDWHHIACQQCGIETRKYKTKQDAYTAWCNAMPKNILMPVNCGCGGNTDFLKCHYGKVRIYCTDCGAKGPMTNDPASAILKWNKAMGHA